MNAVTSRILASSAAAAPTLAGALVSHEALAEDKGGTYDITVTGLWTADRFPVEYPEAGLLTGPHLSGVIGASHNDKYMLFKEGLTPTAGLERLSEEGKHSPLDDEIKAAIAAGTAGALFETDPIRDFSESVTGSVPVDAAHPMVLYSHQTAYTFATEGCKSSIRLINAPRPGCVSVERSLWRRELCCVDFLVHGCAGLCPGITADNRPPSSRRRGEHPTAEKIWTRPG